MIEFAILDRAAAAAILAGMAHTIDGRSLSLIKLGGALGIASALIGLAVFLTAIFRFDAVLMLSILPLGLGGVGMILIIVGTVMHVPEGADETAPIAGLFCCLFGVVFGAIGWWIWSGMQAPAA